VGDAERSETVALAQAKEGKAPKREARVQTSTAVRASTTSPPQVIKTKSAALLFNYLPIQTHQKFDICFYFFEALEEEFHGFGTWYAFHGAAKGVDFLHFVRMVEKFLFARTAFFDIDCGEDSLVDEASVEVEFEISCAFEFLENDFVHF
jgi:hypothetical protein